MSGPVRNMGRDYDPDEIAIDQAARDGLKKQYARAKPLAITFGTPESIRFVETIAAERVKGGAE